MAGATTKVALSGDQRVVVLTRVPDDGELTRVLPVNLADDGMSLSQARLVGEPATGRSA